MDMKNTHYDINVHRVMRFSAMTLLLSCSLPAMGRDYFDPGLLSLSGGQSATTVDLTTFETAGQIPADQPVRQPARWGQFGSLALA